MNHYILINVFLLSFLRYNLLKLYISLSCTKLYF
uniref:Uncharacterized protein n=1 Tax=Polysiphonia sp. TaxID=1967842 RepID=A0A1Z1M4C8_9FLOR|nr:hypothetical protein [Polysiphonia sp.]